MNDQLLDISAINETRLDSTINDWEVRIPGYDIIRKDRNRQGGGGCCFHIRSSIVYNKRKDLVPSDMECVCVEVCRPPRVP